MGRSLNGKELGKGISQRKDGLYQGRFVNRFGKTQTIYAPTLSKIRQKLRDEQYEDDKKINVVKKDVTLDEWFDVWLKVCKQNCRESTKETYLYSKRLAVGLSEKVVVIEIEEMDKAIVSVKYALDYSKTILVIPMDLDSKYKGNNKLIKEGADVLASIDDLVDN